MCVSLIEQLWRIFFITLLPDDCSHWMIAQWSVLPWGDSPCKNGYAISWNCFVRVSVLLLSYSFDYNTYHVSCDFWGTCGCTAVLTLYSGLEFGSKSLRFIIMSKLCGLFIFLRSFLVMSEILTIVGVDKWGGPACVPISWPSLLSYGMVVGQ